MPLDVRRTPDTVPWSRYSHSPLSSRPHPLGSGGDTAPCEDTREDFGLSFSCQRVLLQGGFQVSLLRSPQTSPNTGIPVVTGGREAGSCQSDGRAIAGGMSVDTGTHKRVANWSPDSVATVDPCDLGTDPKNGPFAGIPPAIPFNLNTDGMVSELVAVRRHLPYSLAEISFLSLDSASRSALGWSIGYRSVPGPCVDLVEAVTRTCCLIDDILSTFVEDLAAAIPIPTSKWRLSLELAV